MLYLGGISTEDLNNIIDYIYNGEVEIYQDDLDRFLTVAQRFKLEGLIGSDFQMDINETKASNENFIDSVVESKSDLDLEFTNSTLKSEKKVVKRNINKSIVAVSNNADQVNHYLEVISNESCRCSVCGKVFTGHSRTSDVKKHIETHIEGISYECPVCQKIFRSKNALYSHKYRTH